MFISFTFFVVAWLMTIPSAPAETGPGWLTRGTQKNLQVFDGTAAKKKPEATELKRDARLVSLLRNAVDSASGEDGWSNLSAVRTQIDNQAPFDPRNHGFKKFSDLIDAIGLFETERRGQNLYVRDKRQARSGGRGG